MWFLCQEPYETFDSIHKECYGLFFKRIVYVVLWWKWIEKGDVE